MDEYKRVLFHSIFLRLHAKLPVSFKAKLLKHSLFKSSKVYILGFWNFLINTQTKEGDLNQLFQAILKKDRENFLNDKIRFEWTYQLFDALSYMHSMKIIHRDIKPRWLSFYSHIWLSTYMLATGITMLRVENDLIFWGEGFLQRYKLGGTLAWDIT